MPAAWLPLTNTDAVCFSLKFVVIDLDPVAIGVLQIYLLNLVGPELWRGAVLCPVAVFDMCLVEVFREGRHRRDTEGKMYIDIVGNIFFCPGNHVQLTVFR